MMAQAVARHLGVAILPRFLVEDQLTAGTIVQHFNQSIRSENSYYLVAPDAKASSSHVPAFARWILTEAKAE
jgi:LysR family transcriptional regulator, glycine cleavage system transcriptional activator